MYIKVLISPTATFILQNFMNFAWERITLMPTWLPSGKR